MSDTDSDRPTVLFVGSYGETDKSYSIAEKEHADKVAFELGRVFIEKDIDLAVGGGFKLAVPFAAGATLACNKRGLKLRDRLTYYYAEDWPPPVDASAGKLFQIDDTDNFWLRILKQTDALVAFSGRDNTKSAIDCAELIGIDIFPFGTAGGASEGDLEEVFRA